MFVTREINEKTDRLIKLMELEGLGGLILNAQHNFSWLSAGGSNGIDLSRENGAASLFITRTGDRYVLANNIEIRRLLAEQLPEDIFTPVSFSWQEEKQDPGIVTRLAMEITDGAPIASDIPIASVPIAVEGKIAPCRYQLTSEELERYRELGQDAASALMELIKELQTGQTEIEIEASMRDALGKRNIHSVVSLVAADKRIEQYRHPSPTQNKWQNTLLLVTCAKRGGLIVSLSRVISVGEPSDDLKRKTGAAAFVNANLLAETVEGRSGAELYRTAAEAYARCGYEDQIDHHHQGGATGYRTREWVAHPSGQETVLHSQAFAWNPTITGTKVEETVVLTESGVETITRSPALTYIETTIGGKTYYSPDIFRA